MFTFIESLPIEVIAVITVVLIWTAAYLALPLARMGDKRDAERLRRKK